MSKNVMPRHTASILCLWLAIGGYFAYEVFDALILWVTLSIPFGFLIYIAWVGKLTVLRLLMILVFMSHAILPPIFLILRDEYSYSGWGAVKSFDFRLESFFEIYVSLFLFYACIVISLTIIINGFQSNSFSSRIISDKFSQSNSENKRVTKKNFRDIELIFYLLIFSVLNYWMFSSNIGLTGLTGGQEPLPFKLAGILYYFTRFFVPIIIIIKYRNSSRSLLLMGVIFSYAIFAGFSQVSRALFSFLVIPILAICMFDRRWKTLFVLFFLYTSIFPWIEAAREFVYAYSDGVVLRNSNDSLFYILEKVISEPPSIDLLKIISNIISRVGGGQDVILGSQYNSSLSGGSWVDFCRIFFRIDSGFDAHYELFGFEPPFGFSTGSGGFSSMMLQIGGGNYLVLFLMTFPISIFILAGEWLCKKYETVFGVNGMKIVVASIFVLFFYILGDFMWFYQFLLFAIGVLIFKRFLWNKKVLNLICYVQKTRLTAPIGFTK